MRTVTIDIIDEKALRLLHDLELLKLIKMHRAEPAHQTDVRDWSRYKGAMTKQPVADLDRQLNELRNVWE
jgi:hypothetical protein